MDAATIANLVNFGSAGAVIIVVIIFLNYIGKRDSEWRDFFTQLNRANMEDMSKLTKAIDCMSLSVSALGNKLDIHDGHVDIRIREIQNAERHRLKQAVEKRAVNKTDDK